MNHLKINTPFDNLVISYNLFYVSKRTIDYNICKLYTLKSIYGIS